MEIVIFSGKYVLMHR